MASRNYQDLRAWQLSIDVVVAVYEITKKWPSYELYGLTSQVRRAAVSIASNIAEGQGRRTPKDFVRYLNMAHGSLREVETQLQIASRLGYLTDEAREQLLRQSSETGKVITGLIGSIHKEQ